MGVCRKSLLLPSPSSLINQPSLRVSLWSYKEPLSLPGDHLQRQWPLSIFHSPLFSLLSSSSPSPSPSPRSHTQTTAPAKYPNPQCLRTPTPTYLKPYTSTAATTPAAIASSAPPALPPSRRPPSRSYPDMLSAPPPTASARSPEPYLSEESLAVASSARPTSTDSARGYRGLFTFAAKQVSKSLDSGMSDLEKSVWWALERLNLPKVTCLVLMPS